VANGDGADARERRVTPLELFFDLVFVFAITRVTTLLAEDPTWGGLGRGLLVLGALWWAWCGFAWLTNTMDAEVGAGRLVIFVAMGGMLVASLAVPTAFAANALVFALAIVVVRIAHLVVYTYAADTAAMRTAVLRMSAPMVLAMGLLVLAAAFEGWLQAACWIVALLVDYTAPLRSGNSGWRVHPGHFAERHGLIVIIALGESIVALGIGTGPDVLAGRAIVATLLGLAVVGALWWAYFDVVALVAERKLTSLTGATRNAMARDSYSYLHYLLVAGIVLFALGLKKTLAHLDEPLALVPAVALCGGPALYLAGHVLFRLRNLGTVNRQRVVVVVALAALVPVAHRADALWGLTAVAALCVALIGYEAIRFAEARAHVRHAGAIETS
jgi:low temperature requirement protein LtrA